MNNVSEVNYITLGYIATSAIFAGSLVWWLSEQFKNVRKFFYESIKELQSYFEKKMESHEKSDQARFEKLTDEIWQIKIRNAARDGVLPVSDLKPKE